MQKVFSIFLGLILLVFPFISLAHTGNHGEMTATQLNNFFWWGVAAAVGLGAIAGLWLAKGKKDVKSGILIGLAISLLGSSVSYAILGTEHSPATSMEQPAQASLIGAKATVHKSPGCTCCEGFIAILRKQGVAVTVNEISDTELNEIKQKYGVAKDIESCHTTIMDGYVIEGHMPMEVIAKLRTEKPEITGIALPGMPAGSPGMGGAKTETYHIQTLDGKEYLSI